MYGTLTCWHHGRSLPFTSSSGQSEERASRVQATVHWALIACYWRAAQTVHGFNCWNYHRESHWICGDASCFHVIVDVLSKASQLEACLSWTIPLYELKLASSARQSRADWIEASACLWRLKKWKCANRSLFMLEMCSPCCDRFTTEDIKLSFLRSW